tara:strand:- start:636 stop:872 length:237 start_codon:yes stop_codon:yes gene_type:complete
LTTPSALLRLAGNGQGVERRHDDGDDDGDSDGDDGKGRCCCDGDDGVGNSATLQGDGVLWREICSDAITYNLCQSICA